MKRLRRVLGWLLIVTAIVVIVHTLLVPTWVERMAVSRLRAMGLHDVALRVERVGLREVRVAAIEAGRSEDLRIHGAVITGRPADLLSGRFDTIDLTDVRFKAFVRDGALDLGTLLTPTEPTDAELPFRVLHLHGSMLELDWEGKVVRLPMRGRIIHRGSGQLDLDLRMELVGLTVPITGQVDTATGDADLAATVAMVGDDTSEVVKFRYQRTGGAVQVAVDAAQSLRGFDARLAGVGIAAEGLEVRLEATLDGTMRINALESAVNVRRLHVNDQRFHEVRINADRRDDGEQGRVVVALEAAGGAMEQIQAELRLPDDVKQWIRPSGSDAAEARWSMLGHLPDYVRLLLLEDGIVLDPATRLRFAGRANVHATDHAGEPWWVDLRAEAATVEAMRFDMPGQQIGGSIRDGALELVGRVDAKGAAFHMGQASRATLESLNVADNARVLSEPVTVMLEPLGDAPFVTMSFDGGRVRETVVALAASTREPIALMHEGMTVGLARVEGAVDLRLPADDPLSGTAHVAVSGGELSHETWALHLAEIDARMPMRFGSAAATDGDAAADSELTIGRVIWRDHTLAPVTGELVVADGRVHARGHWPLSHHAKLAAQLDVHTLSPLRGTLAIEAPLFEVSPADALGALLMRAFDLDVDGRFAVTGSVRFSPWRVTSDVQVVVDDASVRSSAIEASMTGVNGSVTLTGLAPLTSRSSQQLSIDQLQLGRLQLNEGVIAFAIEASDQVFVEQMRWQWGDGGVFHVHAFRYNHAAPVIDTQVFLENLPMDEWLSLLTGGTARGEGRLHGRIPVFVEFGAERPVRLGAGWVYGGPEPGRLMIEPTQEMRQMLARTVGTGPESQLVQERLLEALQDFSYERLTFDFIPVDGSLTLRARTAGVGLRGARQQVADLTINWADFDEAVYAGLLIAMSADEAVDRMLERFFDHR